MQAIGKDGQYHDWADLTEQERQAWEDAMTEADRIYEARKYGRCRPSFIENLITYEQKQNLF